MVKFKGNRIIYVVGYNYQQEGPWTEPVETYRKMKYAEVYDRRGSNSQPYQQNIWEYDIIVKMRRSSARPTQSNDQIEYGGRVLKISGVRVDREDFEQFELCYCQYIDEAVGQAAVPGGDNMITETGYDLITEDNNLIIIE